jgi:hypothetical protein
MQLYIIKSDYFLLRFAGFQKEWMSMSQNQPLAGLAVLMRTALILLIPRRGW